MLVAGVDTHTVHALRAADGKAAWRYTAGARVDSPPTVDEGLAIAVRHGEWLRPDGGAGFQADAVVPVGGGDTAQQKALALLKLRSRGALVPGSVDTPFDYAAFVEDDYS